MIRSWLFVPGDSPRKLARGRVSGADALILDLEDSVAPERKRDARAMVAEALLTPAEPALWVRINPLDEGGLDDLAAIVRAGPAGIMLPKAAGPAGVLRLSHGLDALERRDGVTRPLRILPVATETAAAPFALGAYAAAALPRLHGLTWGAEDLATALGASTNRDGAGWASTYRLVRALTLLAARAAGVEPIETLHADFRDTEGLRLTSLAAATEGFTGRLAIHPDQVPIINAAFLPSPEAVAHARRVLAAFAAAPGAGAVSLDGQMLDVPHLKQARRILEKAGALPRTPLGSETPNPRP